MKQKCNTGFVLALSSKVLVLADDYSDTYTTLKQQMAGLLLILGEAQWRLDTVAQAVEAS